MSRSRIRRAAEPIASRSDSGRTSPPHVPSMEPTTKVLESVTVPPFPSVTVRVADPSKPLINAIVPDALEDGLPAKDHAYVTVSPSESDALAPYWNCVSLATPKVGENVRPLMTGTRFACDVGVVGVVGVDAPPPPAIRKQPAPAPQRAGPDRPVSSCGPP